MGARTLITIALPPPLLRRAERLARRENRTRAELVQEALELYVSTQRVRKRVVRERVGALMRRSQARTRGVSPRQIRRIVREAVEAARRGKRRASA